MKSASTDKYSFLHRTPLSLRTLDALASRHEQSLRSLRFHELQKIFRAGISLPRNLEELECRSINDGSVVAALLQANKGSLRKLCVGQEKHLVEQYRQTRIGYLEQISPPAEPFRNALQLHDFPNLREVNLNSLDLSPLLPQSIDQAAFFCHLTRLSIESCGGSAAFLASLAETFYHLQNTPDAFLPLTTRKAPQLVEFLLRSESPTTHLKESLARFLASFRGLRQLSLLFENAVLLERVSSLIAEHGPTLQSLTLESRIQPRESLAMDTSRPFGVGGYSQELWEESINDICRLCPNLVELGTGFPWDDETVRLRKTRLPTLERLRTIHIRNFPQNQVLSQLGDYHIREYATKFIDWVFPPLVGASRPSLETFAMGPTLYESRWKSSMTSKQPPEYLRTHHFCLDWAKTRFGRWSPMITAVSERCIEELRGEKPLSGIFEQVWLR